MIEQPAKIEPPRTRKGRRARRIWRELAPQLAAAERLNAGSRALLAVYASTIANIEADPAEPSFFDLRDAKQLGRALGLTK